MYTISYKNEYYPNYKNTNDNACFNHQHVYLQPQQYQHLIPISTSSYIPAHINNQEHYTNYTMSNTSKLKQKEVVLYKTESCRNWTELGHCRYGKKCRYAHGASELRRVPRHTRYKTQICRAYHMDGSCPYGIRCTFVHDSDNINKPEEPMSPIPTLKRRKSLDDESTSSSDGSSTVSSYSKASEVFMMKQSIETMYNNSNVFINHNNKTMWM